MQQWYKCIRCGAPVAFGDRFCTMCGIQLSQPMQQVQQPLRNEQEDPSLHIIPLHPITRQPVFYYIDNVLNIPAIATNGRISWLIGTAELPGAVIDRIQYRYPQQQYINVQSYVMCGVMYRLLNKKEAVLIFEVWGFWEHLRELDELYNILHSLGGEKVGDKQWNQVAQNLTTDPIKTWINTLIDFLKKELNWKDYVHQFLDEMQ